MRPITLLPALALLVLAACNQGNGAEPPRWAEVEALVKRQDYAAAYTALEAMQESGRPDAELILRLAEVRRLQGEPVKAILILREAVAADPEAKQLVVPLASLYLEVAEVQLARETLEAARARGVSSPEFALLLGQTYGRLDELELALREFDAALELGAKRHVVLYNKALVLGQQKKHAEAIRALEEVVEAKSDWAAARRELARAILDSLPKDRAQIDRALDLLVGAQADLPEDWRLQESIGDAWLLLGDYDASIQAYTEALRLGRNPKSVEDRYRVAVTKKRELDSAAVPPPAKN